MKKNYLMSQLRSEKKKLIISIVVLMVIAIPPFAVGWHGDLVAPFLSDGALLGYRFLFVFGYILVPPFFFTLF